MLGYNSQPDPHPMEYETDVFDHGSKEWKLSTPHSGRFGFLPVTIWYEYWNGEVNIIDIQFHGVSIQHHLYAGGVLKYREFHDDLTEFKLSIQGK